MFKAMALALSRSARVNRCARMLSTLPNLMRFGVSTQYLHPCTKSSALQVREFSGKAPLSLKSLEERVMLVLSLYDKIDAKKLTMDSSFINDLGLDSLDHVEVIMALEDEFGFEIPDGDADNMKTPRDIFKYICDKEDVYE